MSSCVYCPLSCPRNYCHNNGRKVFFSLRQGSSNIFWRKDLFRIEDGRVFEHYLKYHRKHVSTPKHGPPYRREKERENEQFTKRTASKFS